MALVPPRFPLVRGWRREGRMDGAEEKGVTYSKISPMSLAS